MTANLILTRAGRALFPDKAFDALLFDMDGTLLTSIGASERVWGAWARGYGLNAQDFLPHSHGKRVADVIAGLGIPGIDPVREAERILAGELADVEGVAPVAGAGAFLESLPPRRWAIVTSAPRVLALRRLTVAELPIPPVLITAEDVARGKPNPTCFQLAAARLDAASHECVVFEDALAGIQAGEAAGSAVVVVTAAHEVVLSTEQRPQIHDYSEVRTTVV